MITVVDYGVGNLSSVANMLKKVGADVLISSNAKDILGADKLILPGVGNYDYGMECLETTGIREIIHEFAIHLQRPVLGICLGAQIMGTASDEGERPGLGWIDMTCKRFQATSSLRVPHMSWNQIQITKHSVLLEDLDKYSRFYFVHSYYMCCSDQSDIIAISNYGHPFVSAFQHDNLIGVQFHPEKSHKHGFAIMNAFANRLF